MQPCNVAPRIVWHYTDAASLRLVVENHTMRASALGFMNDADELATGVRRFRKELRRLRHKFVSPDEEGMDPNYGAIRELIRDYDSAAAHGSAFALCLSRDGDDNALWDRYAGRDGVAIGIRYDACMPVLGVEPSGPVVPGSLDRPLRWTRMVYGKRKQREMVEQTIATMHDVLTQNSQPEEGLDFTRMFESMAMELYVDAVASMKNAGFRSEREYRYVIERPSDAAVNVGRPRAGRISDTPYVTVTGCATDVGTFEADWPQYQESVAPLPIEKVRLGPARNSNYQLAEVVALLNHQGYGAVKVVRSRSTQRHV